MIADLSKSQQFHLAVEGMSEIEWGNGRSLQEGVRNEYGVELENDVAQALSVLTESYAVAEPGDAVEAVTKDGMGSGEAMNVHEIAHQSHESGGDVYMGVDLNQEKARVVWDMGRDDFTEEESDNIVVKLPSSDNYDLFKESFGWKRLADINLNNIHKYDISEREYNDIVSEIETVEEDGDEVTSSRSNPTPPEQEKINVSVSRKHTEQRKLFAKDIREQFGNDDTIAVKKKETARFRRDRCYQVDTLVLCPSNSEKNLSDHYWMGGNKYSNRTVALGNCNVKTYEYLEDLENVYHIDKFTRNAWRKKIESSEGDVCIANNRDKLVIHVTNEQNVPAFKSAMDRMPDALQSMFDDSFNSWLGRWKWVGPSSDEMIYAPVSYSSFFDILPAVVEGEVRVIYGDASKPKMVSEDNRQAIKRDAWPLVLALLPEWEDTDFMEEYLLSRDFPALSDGGLTCIKTLAQEHDRGNDPSVPI